MGKNRAVVTAKPFKIDIYSDGVLVVSANNRGLLKFEHTRLKTSENEEVSFIECNVVLGLLHGEIFNLFGWFSYKVK